MKRHYSHRQKSVNPITDLKELVNKDLNLLIKLVHRFVDIEKRQQRFRTCMLIRASRIETMLTEIMSCQLAQYWPDRPPMTNELRTKHLKEVEERIENMSQNLGIKMVLFIHEESEKPQEPFDRRQKWWGWEI